MDSRRGEEGGNEERRGEVRWVGLSLGVERGGARYIVLF